LTLNDVRYISAIACRRFLLAPRRRSGWK